MSESVFVSRFLRHIYVHVVSVLTGDLFMTQFSVLGLSTWIHDKLDWSHSLRRGP